MILEQINEKIIHYQERYNDMPNTVLLPSAMFEALKYYTKNMFGNYYDDTAIYKIFDMDIIVVEDYEDIRVTKIIQAKVNRWWIMNTY